jgi:hypothetical protein
MTLALVDHEGRPMEDYTPATPSAEVEVKEPTLDEIAERAAQQQSTTKHQ